MILSAIAAMAANRVVGRNGDLPWRIPEDFKFFKDKTTGHIMIMGRKTFDSLKGPLPKRMHIVITRATDYNPAGAVVVHSVEEALERARLELKKGQWPNEVFIIGGGEIWNQTMSILDRIYLTEIKKSYEGDAHFPEFDKSQFKEVERRERNEPEAFDFVIYERARR
jgi:dihydrofolate reductase